MKLSNFYLYILLIVLLFNLSGCNSDESACCGPSNPILPGEIYIAGTYSTGGKEYGAYWVANNNGTYVRVDLDDARVIHDIKVRNGVVYAVGETTWASGEQDPAIWIDGVKTELYAPNNDETWGGATAFALAFDGDDIYISGNYASEKASLGGVSSACYWILNDDNPQGKLYPLQSGVSSDAYGCLLYTSDAADE